MDLTMLNKISDEVKKYNARLLPVIKGRETEEILKVYNEGFREFGENRLEELLDHKSNFKDCHFHFIAPLQSRKIPEILENSNAQSNAESPPPKILIFLFLKKFLSFTE